MKYKIPKQTVKRLSIYYCILLKSFPVGRMIFSTIVGTTVIYEIIGPIWTKLVLQKAGHIDDEKRQFLFLKWRHF